MDNLWKYGWAIFQLPTIVIIPNAAFKYFLLLLEIEMISSISLPSKAAETWFAA